MFAVVLTKFKDMPNMKQVTGIFLFLSLGFDDGGGGDSDVAVVRMVVMWL